MKLGNVIYYVENVEKTMAFFEKAFGLERAFLDPSGHYGQLETGTTALGFASLEYGQQNFPQGMKAVSSKEIPGFEIAFVAKNVPNALMHALESGAELVAPAEEKPWGQTVAYVRDFNGILVEIGSDMSACQAESCCCH